VDSPNERRPGPEAAGLPVLRESNGADLRSCSAYVCEQITRERADTNASGDNVETNCELNEVAK
jgi:hypothetical protein